MLASNLLTLGPLEVQLLQSLWVDEPQTARQVYETLRLSRKIAYTTVAKTLDRLVLKGVLQRDTVRVDRSLSYCYAPRLNRSQLLLHMVEQTMTLLGIDTADHQNLVLALSRATGTTPHILASNDDGVAIQDR